MQSQSPKKSVISETETGKLGLVISGVLADIWHVVKKNRGVPLVPGAHLAELGPCN